MFGNPLFRKHSIAGTGILEGMTDVHCHLLPGVDDGMPDAVSSHKAIACLKGMGVSRFFFTPHVMTDYPDNNAELLPGKFAAFAGKINSMASFRLCAEYMLDTDFRKHLDNHLLTYDGQHVLLETSYIAPPMGLAEILKNVMSKGFVPVIAHPERYIYMELPDYAALKETGCLFQLNLMSLGGVYGEHARHYAKLLLAKGYYSFAGSDLHCLGIYLDFLERRLFTAKTLDALATLFANNALLWRE